MQHTEVVEPFSAERRRQELRQDVQAAERALSDAATALREYQGEFYSATEWGLTVRVDKPNDRDVIDRGHRERVLALSAAHDKFQAALKSFSEAA